MAATLTYIHDPLCGWCYAAAPLVAAIADDPIAGLDLVLVHRALFTGAHAMPHTPEFARYAWSNDQRIAHLTGQPFSDAYRDGVLGNRHQSIDSWNTALAKQAVDAMAPGRAPAYLKLMQHARFVDGADLTDRAVLAGLGAALDLDVATLAGTIAAPATAESAAAERDQATEILARMGHNGVPLLVLDAGNGPRAVDHGRFLGQPAAFRAALAETFAA